MVWGSAWVPEEGSQGGFWELACAGVRSDTGGNLYLTLGTSTAKRDRSMVFDGDDCHRGETGRKRPPSHVPCGAGPRRPPGDRGLSADRGLEKAPFH